MRLLTAVCGEEERQSRPTVHPGPLAVTAFHGARKTSEQFSSIAAMPHKAEAWETLCFFFSMVIGKRCGLKCP